MGNFDDLIPKKSILPIKKSDGAFDDLIPSNQAPDENIPAGNSFKRFATLGPISIASSPRATKIISRKLNEEAPNIYQAGGNIIGGMMGASVGNPTAGAAYGGSAARGAYEGYRQLINGEKFNPNKVASETSAGAAGELLGMGINKALDAGIPFAQKSAKRIVKSVINPKGKLAEKGAEMAQTALEEGLSGTKQNMLNRTYGKMTGAVKEVDGIIEKYKSRQITAEKALGYLDELEKGYFKEGDSEASNYIKNNLKPALIAGRNLIKPVYGDVEKGAFQMGGGTLTKPKKIILNKDNFGDMGERLSPTKKPRIIEETNYQGKTRGLEGPSRKVTEVISQEPRLINLDEGREALRGQYSTLARKKSEAGYLSESKSPEIEGRQTYARGFKESIEEAVPEENIAGKNARIGRLIDLSAALEDRIPIADRQNLFGIKDAILAGGGITNPKALAILTANKMLGTDTAKNALAQNLYKASTLTGGYGDLARLPTAKDFLENKYGGALARAYLASGFSRRRN